MDVTSKYKIVAGMVVWTASRSAEARSGVGVGRDRLNNTLSQVAMKC